MISLQNLSKSFSLPKRQSRTVLDGIHFQVNENQSIAIRGRSGSGKTTLLNILIGLDSDFTGTYLFDNEEVYQYTSGRRATFRQTNLGIITQHFDLLDDRNVYENLVLSLQHLKLERAEKKRLIAESLAYVDLAGVEKKSIKQLSGGEMQRIAIARALVKKPKIVVADEPTGALDEETRDNILQLFQKMMSDGHQFIIVTHDKAVASICDRKYYLHGGKLERE